MLSRGLRNCNPGNIRLSVSRFQGEVAPSSDTAFKQFESMAWGYRAMFIIIRNYNDLYGINTLDKIIERWAPSHENETDKYLRCVANRIGCSTTAYIDGYNREVMSALVASMSWIENGAMADPAEIDAGWRLVAN